MHVILEALVVYCLCRNHDCSLYTGSLCTGVPICVMFGDTDIDVEHDV